MVAEIVERIGDREDPPFESRVSKQEGTITIIRGMWKLPPRDIDKPFLTPIVIDITSAGRGGTVKFLTILNR